MLNITELKIIAAEYAVNDSVVEDRFDELFEYYTYPDRVKTSDMMPYGVAKARTGDPYQWIGNKLDELNAPAPSQADMFTH